MAKSGKPRLKWGRWSKWAPRGLRETRWRSSNKTKTVLGETYVLEMVYRTRKKGKKP